MAASPGIAQLTGRPDLRGSVVEVWNETEEAASFIADEVASRIDVPFAGGTIRRLPREAFTKDPATLERGPEGTYARGDWGDQTYTYFTKEQAQEMPVDENMKAQTALYYDAEKAAARIAFSRCKRGHEKTVAAAIMNTGTFTGSQTGGCAASWKSNATTATPVADIRQARFAVRLGCGRDANTLILGWQAWEYLKETSQVLARVTGGARPDIPGTITLEDLQRILSINRIIVAKSVQDTAKQGQTFSGSDLWSDSYAMIAYINPAPSLQDINLCNAYNWEGDGGSWDWTVETYYDLPTRRDVIRVRRQVGVKVEYPECGYLLTGITA